jgi:hypothetical protein
MIALDSDANGVVVVGKPYTLGENLATAALTRIRPSGLQVGINNPLFLVLMLNGTAEKRPVRPCRQAIPHRPGIVRAAGLRARADGL